MPIDATIATDLLDYKGFCKRIKLLFGGRLSDWRTVTGGRRVFHADAE